MDMKKACWTPEEKKVICNRLSRLEGQIKGVKKMAENECDCNDILIQLAAVQKSAESVSNIMLEDHLRHCLEKISDEKETFEDLITLFKRFM